MRLDELQGFIFRVVRYYDQKSAPDPKTIKLWLEDVQGIPSEALPGMWDLVKEWHDSYPCRDGFPKIMKRAFAHWLKNNLHKKAHQSDVEAKCHIPGCANGILMLWDADNILRCYRCASCGRSSINTQSITIREADERGLVLDTMAETESRNTFMRKVYQESRGFPTYGRQRGGSGSSVGDDVKKIKEMHGWR